MTKEKIDITKYTKYFKAIFFITAVINILLFAQKKETILEKADRKASGKTAPACGLYLKNVNY